MHRSPQPVILDHAVTPRRVPTRHAIGVVLALAVLLPSVGLAAELGYVPGEVLVKFRDDASVLGVQQVLAGREEHRRLSDRVGQLRIRPGETVEQVVLELEALPEVEYAEPNYLRQVQQVAPPNDPRFDWQWALHNTGQALPVPETFPAMPGADIGALAAWSHTTGSHDVVVAIIDTGVDLEHPELAPNRWQGSDGNAGRSFIGSSTDTRDLEGHGTRMAGIIGARGANGIGMAGVSWDVSLMVLRVFGSSGSGSVDNIVAAIDYAVANGAQIINASFGATRTASRFEREAIAAAGAAGVLFVAAACNDGADNDNSAGDTNPCYPASYDLPNIIAVAATDSADGLIPESNYGARTVHLGAPGRNILTLSPLLPGQSVNDSLNFVTGTSAAAAFVTGAAALLLAQNPALDAGLMRAALLENVEPATNLQARTVSGGRLDVARALASDTASMQSSGTRAPTSGSGSIGAPELICLLVGILLLQVRRLRKRGAARRRH